MTHSLMNLITHLDMRLSREALKDLKLGTLLFYPSDGALFIDIFDRSPVVGGHFALLALSK